VGVNRDGAFAGIWSFRHHVFKFEAGIPEKLCSAFDPLGNAVHTALTTIWWVRTS
jgi:threonine 3-dehydrogenase